MSTEETHEHEETKVEQGPAKSPSPRKSDGPSGQGVDEANTVQNLIDPPPPLGLSSQSVSEIDTRETLAISSHIKQQQAQPSGTGIGQLLPLFAGEERGSRSPYLQQQQQQQQQGFFLHPQNGLRVAEQLHRFGSSTEMGRNCGGPFSVDPQAARGTGTSLGRGYHLPTSNLQTGLRMDSSSRLQQSPIQKPYPHNPLGVAIGASPFTTTQWAKDPNRQPQLSLGLGRTQEIQFHELVGPNSGSRSYNPGAGSSSSNQTLFPNIQQQGYLSLHPNQREMGESSSRNVRMKMTLQDNVLPSAELQLGSLLIQTGQGSVDPRLPRPTRNSIYDPKYEAMGLPVDPHLRMFLAKHNQGGNSRGEHASD